MKRGLALFMVVVLVFSIAGCSNSGSGDTKKDEPTKEETKKDITFERVEKLLNDNGYAITETTETAAQMIGATEGKKYHTDKGVIEVYKFDKASDAYKKAEADGVVTLSGFGDLAIATNNGFGMFTDKADENLIKLFKAL